MKRIILLLTLLLLTLHPVALHAFNQVNARALAMGGAHTTLSRGVEVIGWNPAFMAFDDNPDVSVYTPLLNFGFRLSNDFISMRTVGDYFQDGLYWTDEIKESFLSEIEGDAWDFYTDFYLPLVAFSFPTQFIKMAVSYDLGFSSDWRFSREFVELAIKGNGQEYLGQRRDFSDTSSRYQLSSRLGLTFAKSFNELPDLDWMSQLTAGFTFTYYIGHAFAEVVDAEGSMLMDVGVFEGSGKVESINAGITGAGGNKIEADPFAGNGVGLDLGVGARLFDDRLTLGLSVINLIQSMEWTGAQRRINSYELFEAPTFSGLTSPDEWFEKNMTLVDSLVESNTSVRTELPQSVHIDGGYELGEDLHVSASVRYGMNDATGGSSKARFGAGLEWHTLRSFPIRVGASVGGRSALSYGMGFGLYQGFWHTDFGWAWERGFLDSATGLHLAIRTTFFF